MPSMPDDHATWAWAASLLSGALAYLARGLGIARDFGKIEAELKNLHAKFDRLESRINTHLDRRD